VLTIRFFAPTDRFVEVDWAKGSFGALVSNSGSWSSRVSGNHNVLARNLTFKDSSNQVAVQLPVAGASNVPNPVRQGLSKRSFNSMRENK
jgi:hypothetical protein